MVQRGRGEGFTLETFASSAVFRQLFGKELQRDMPVPLEVFGFIHNAHSAATQLRNDAVVGHGLADEGIRIGHWPNILGSVPNQVNDVQPHGAWLTQGYSTLLMSLSRARFPKSLMLAGLAMQ